MKKILSKIEKKRVIKRLRRAMKTADANVSVTANNYNYIIGVTAAIVAASNTSIGLCTRIAFKRS
jgi:protoporphyrinogen oxidase|tara:strand:+ start:1424 stop:1618 length:195 start_codon:yes stop_codon:yes gene_type:complete